MQTPLKINLTSEFAEGLIREAPIAFPDLEIGVFPAFNKINYVT